MWSDLWSGPGLALQVYVQKVSPPKTPQVVGKLLDLDANEDFVRMLLQSVGMACPVEELVEQVRREGLVSWPGLGMCGGDRVRSARAGLLFLRHL